MYRFINCNLIKEQKYRCIMLHRRHNIKLSFLLLPNKQATEKFCYYQKNLLLEAINVGIISVTNLTKRFIEKMLCSKTCHFIRIYFTVLKILIFYEYTRIMIVLVISGLHNNTRLEINYILTNNK